jgi:hypothetical protein
MKKIIAIVLCTMFLGLSMTPLLAGNARAIVTVNLRAYNFFAYPVSVEWSVDAQTYGLSFTATQAASSPTGTAVFTNSPTTSVTGGVSHRYYFRYYHPLRALWVDGGYYDAAFVDGGSQTISIYLDGPSAHTNPTPSDGATDVNPTSLAWIRHYPNTNSNQYVDALYFGTTYPPPHVTISGTDFWATSSISLSLFGITLQPMTTYYWYTEEHSAFGENLPAQPARIPATAQSQIWSFTTGAGTATATGPTGGPSTVAAITITYTWTNTPTSVNLYYTTNGGTTWTLAGNDATVDGSYAFTCSAAGTYSWIASAVGGGSVELSPPTGGTVPEAASYIFDNVRPTITNTVPANGAINVAITDNVVVTFSEAMNTGTVTYTCVPAVTVWSVVWSGGNTIATYSHTNPFAYGTLYTFTITAGSDVAGNLLNAGAVPNPWTFTTVAQGSATATGPIGGPSTVAAITITYTWTDTPTSVNLYYTINSGTTWTLAGNDATVDGSYAFTCPAAGTYGWIASAVGGGSVELSPPTGGTVPEAASYIFDNIRPTIANTVPANGATLVAVAATVVVTFSEAMNTGTVTYTCVPAVAVWSVVWSGGNTIATYSHTNPYAYSTLYTFTITAGSDVAGNLLNAGAAPNPWTFTTVAQGSATATGPTDGPSTVAAITITYTFTGAPTSVNLYYTTNGGTTWTLAGNDATVDGTYAFTCLASGTYGWITSAVAGGSVELSPPTGGTVPEAASYIFDNVRPTITNTVPANGATLVAVAATVVVTFSEAMNTGTVTYTCVPAVTVWSVVWSGGNTIATYSHTNPFAYNTLYTFTITAGSDVAGNLLNAGAVPNPWTFTTVAQGSATATGPTGGPSTVAAIPIPYTWTDTPTSVNLYYTTNGGTTWTLAGNDATVDGSYAFTCPAAGTYGWIASAVGGGSVDLSPPTGGTVPEAASYIFDNVRPTITNTVPANGAINVAITDNVVVTFSLVSCMERRRHHRNLQPHKPIRLRHSVHVHHNRRL